MFIFRKYLTFTINNCKIIRVQKTLMLILTNEVNIRMWEIESTITIINCTFFQIIEEDRKGNVECVYYSSSYIKIIGNRGLSSVLS